MTINGSIPQTSFTETTSPVKQRTITELRIALQNLDNLKGNVQNCNCDPSNCCQSIKCQSCQSVAPCQACQTCQSQCYSNCCQDCTH